jgi:hypothetical protein
VDCSVLELSDLGQGPVVNSHGHSNEDSVVTIKGALLHNPGSLYLVRKFMIYVDLTVDLALSGVAMRLRIYICSIN